MRMLVVAIGVLLASASLAQQADELRADVQVRRLTLMGGTVLTPADRRQIVRDITRQTYMRDNLEEIAQRVLYAYQERGYFKTAVEDPKITIVRRDAQHEVIDAVVTVNASRLYRLKDIAFTGNKVFPGDELRKEFSINAGDVFDTGKIRTGLEKLLQLYCTKGYVNLVPVPDTKVDDAAGLISLEITLDEGPVFHLGTLTVRGVESQPGAREKLLAAWKLYQGEAYDCDTLQRFLRDIGARPGIHPEEIFSLSYDVQAHVINVEITLGKPVF